MANYWIVRADHDIRDVVERDSFIGIGYGGTSLGDLSNLSPSQIRSRVEGVYPAKDHSNQEIGSHFGNIRRFIHDINIGDIVFTPIYDNEVLIGRVTGEYTYHPSNKSKPHRRPVVWYEKGSQDDILLPWNGWLTVFNVDKHKNKIAHIIEKYGDDSDSKVSSEEPSSSDLQSLADDLLLPTSFLGEVTTLLEEKKQVIFQGPPGTGKTYVARALAKHLAGSEERVTFVQFHPSYAYEDFVQGFRPTELKNGQAGFRLKEGPLLRAADYARKAPDAKHFLVIDEINRGNLAKVFGELYFLLEYRNEEIHLQYQEENEQKFSLPPNLYIIGTMNTADRSIALVDLALRRRFYFVEFHPDKWPIESLLSDWLDKHAPDMWWVADVVDIANKKLAGVRSEDRHAAIGPSYFMRKDKKGQPSLTAADVERVWEHSILPYVEEHLFPHLDDLNKYKLAALRSEMTHSSAKSDGEEEQNEGEDLDEDGGVNDAPD